MSSSASNQQVKLFAACQDGDASKVEKLIGKSTSGLTFAKVAAQLKGGDRSALQSLKKASREAPQMELLQTRDQQGRTPLHVACGGGYLEIVLMLIQRGAPLEACDRWGRAPLHSAVQSGKVELVSFLLDVGADGGRQDFCGTTSCMMAAMTPQSFIMSALTRRLAAPTFNFQNTSGYTALHIAAFLGYEKVCRALLSKHGVDFEIPTPDVLTPMHCAAVNGHASTVRVLGMRGADVNAVSSTQQTPLLLAVEGEHRECVRALIELGADHKAMFVGQHPLVKEALREIKEDAQSAAAEEEGGDEEPPLLEITDEIPRALEKDFFVEQKQVEAVAGTVVAAYIGTRPIKKGLNFVAYASSCDEEDENNKRIEIDVLDHKTGQYTLLYRQPPGANGVIVKVGTVFGELGVTSQTQWKVATVVPRTVSRHCTAYGPGLFNPEPGKSFFLIRAKDQTGNATIKDGGEGDRFNVTITYTGEEDGGAERRIGAQLQDCRNGTYRCNYVTQEPGKYTIDIRYQDQSIRGFPRDINVEHGTERNKMLISRRKHLRLAIFNAKMEANTAEQNAANRPRKKRGEASVQRCLQCNEQPVNTAVTPCMHFALCHECALTLSGEGLPCPACEQDERETLVTGYIVNTPMDINNNDE